MSGNEDDDRGAGAVAPPRPDVSPAMPAGEVTPSPRDAAGEDDADEAADTASDDASKSKKSLPLWQEVILLLATAFVLALVVKTFLLQAFYIPSASMEPTLRVDDKILVQKVSYWTGEPERGDVVVFDDPGDWLRSGQAAVASNPVQSTLEVIGLYPSGGHLVKRVIAVGGDTVKCCNRGRIVVNGVPLEEDYLPRSTQNQGSYGPIEVPEGQLWVLGDNRANSEDSHAHIGEPGGGFVAVDDVVGKVWAIVWPRQHMQVIDRPEIYEQALGSTSGD